MNILKTTLLCVLASFAGLMFAEEATMSPISETTLTEAVNALKKEQPESEADRIRKGVTQIASLWRTEDGNDEEFLSFCQKQFIQDENTRDMVYKRLSDNLESIWGNFHIVSRDLSEPLDLSYGSPLPVDYMFAAYSPYSHLNDDFFRNKIAFVTALNFPHYSLNEKLKLSDKWTRKDLAYAAVGDLYTSRIPAEVSQKQNMFRVKADNYINEYNIFMGNVLDSNQNTLFPEGLKLITHWGLRDELKGRYADPDGLKKQEMIFQIMNRIIDQSIPEDVINNDILYWEPESNTVYEKQSGELVKKPGVAENGTRYKHFLNVFKGEKMVDPYTPSTPSLIDRRFQISRQIPENEVEALLTSVLSSPVAQNIGELIEKRLGRKLRPFDIWYNGFKSGGNVSEEKLDTIVSAKYPTREAFENNIPAILRELGFSGEKADMIASHITVDPSRGPGHAMGAATRKDKAHLRTRVEKDGMNYKGYNIAIHELGHNVEQVCSLNLIDHYFLNGVPNTAFTEAFAFVFQSRDLELLGLSENNASKHHLDALDTFWSTYEIGGVALVDMKVWKWLYKNPNASPEELQQAVIRIAKNVWNKYYAPVFKVKDVPILAVYSHMIDGAMYLPDYPIGHIIMFQIEEYLKGKTIGVEMERMCKIGSVTPGLWMKEAVGQSLSTEPLIKAAEKAITQMN